MGLSSAIAGQVEGQEVNRHQVILGQGGGRCEWASQLPPSSPAVTLSDALGAAHTEGASQRYLRSRRHYATCAHREVVPMVLEM